MAPDSGKIAFLSYTKPNGDPVSSVGSRPALFVTNGDGSNPRQLTSPNYGDANFLALSSLTTTSFSPDGWHVAVAGWDADDDYPEIYSVDVVRDTLQAVTNDSVNEDYPDWLPDGRIAYQAGSDPSTGDNGQFRTINPDGSGEANVSPFFSQGELLEHISGPQPTHPPNEVAVAFMPNLYFDNSEKWRPISIDSFLGEGSHQVCEQGACSTINSPADLAQFSDPQAYLDIAGSGSSENYHSPDPACTASGLRDCNNPPQSKIYYHKTFGSLPAGPYVYLDYWIFYRYNDAPGVADEVGGAVFGDTLQHEGDWEGVTVALQYPDSTTFDFASFSQHGTWYSYLRSALSCDDRSACGATSQHVDSFVANRSHANYPRTCSAVEAPLVGGQVNCGEDGSSLPEAGGYDGSKPWGGNGLSAALEPFPSSGYEWQFWPGHWGATGTNGSSSPESPGNQQPHYGDPGTTGCPNQDPAPDCGAGPSAAGTRAAATSSPTSCGDWLGHDVSVLACDPTKLRTAFAGARLGRPGALTMAPSPGQRIATAPGLLQAVGPALAGGQRIRLGGDPGAAQLFLRVRSGPKIVTARFNRLSELANSTATVAVHRAAPGPPRVALKVGGKRLAGTLAANPAP